VAKKIVIRPEFRNWVDQEPDPAWSLMPLTHVTKGIGLQDIARAQLISSNNCKTLKEEMSFFFYGRPAFRVSGDGSIKAEAACPTCLIFKPELIEKAEKIHAFDTGAFGKRIYKHIILDEMQISDFSLENDSSRPNKLIKRVFGSKQVYFDADTNQTLKSDTGAESWEFHAKAYLDLINSPGRNEPDDRVCTIEVVFKGELKLSDQLIAVVVPHTLWTEAKKAPYLEKFHNMGVEIVPYVFVPNRNPEYYNAKMETMILDFYKRSNFL
jgi:hypothetical protein